jgi:UPF0755 protein
VLALLLLGFIAAAVLAGVAYVSNQFHSAVGGPARHVTFVVAPGESITGIADDLAHQGLVSSSVLFQLYYRINGGAELIQAGPHALSTTMSIDQIALTLQSPPLPPQKVIVYPCCTFAPGKRAEEIAELLQKNGIMSAASFMHEVRYGQFTYWFLQGRPKGASLEGFLYPGRYEVPKNYSAHQLVNRMLAAFGRNVTPQMHATIEKAHRSVFEVVTIASIVQREEAIAKIQRYIAGVYYNRLDNPQAETNSFLDADATVQYALGYQPAQKTWWYQGLTIQMDDNTISPYNTYIHQGLPPGPIASPGQSALDAAVNPAPSSYYYYQAAEGADHRYHTYFCPTLVCQTNGEGVLVQ